MNSRNIRGYSPLMLAASSDVVPAETVRLLLARGADRSYAGDYDETAHMLAAKRGNTEVTRLLGGFTETSLDQASTLQTKSTDPPNAFSTAIEKAVSLMAKQSYTFIRTGGCNSCHSQDLPSAASGYARQRGVATAEAIPQLPASMMPSPERVVDMAVVSVNSVAWEIFDLGMNHQPRTAYTDAVVRYIKAMQTPDGNWPSNEGRRPPMNSGDFQTAALAIYSITQYGRDVDQVSSKHAVARAVSWLEAAKPVSVQDRAFHLLGLAWGKGSPAIIKASSRALAAMQRADGGWSQMPSMTSDAYATGQAMFALSAGGAMPVTQSVYKKGLQYLLRSQAADGSWHVETRSIWLQPYFESGFPYGRDQFISTAGTAWASMALAAAIPKAPAKMMTQR